jgi:uncharacterized protein
MKRFLNIYFLLVAVVILQSSCDNDLKKEVNFDRKGMLENIGKNIIVPNYTLLKSSVDALETSLMNFYDQPNIDKLAVAQQKFKDAYLKWQDCSIYEFGPADERILRTTVNSFPTRPDVIESNISSGTYNLGAASNLVAKGFPSIDYLLFDEAGDNSAILAKYQGDNATNRKAYLLAVVGDIKANVDYVYNKWTSGGYLQTFINNDGTDAGSSIGFLVNQLNFDYEMLKNEKIGIPLGKKSLDGHRFPREVEGFYSGISKDLAMTHLKAFENVFLGFGTSDGLGFDDYLNALEAKASTNEPLTNAIINQLGKAKGTLSLVQNPLSVAIENNTQEINTAYVEIQKQVRYFKSDMPSVLGVIIQYTDNDGD